MGQESVVKKFNTAIQFEKDGNYSRAMEEYLAILKIDPRCREAYINLGSLYSRMNRLKHAMACYEKALSIHPDFLTYFNIGSIHYKMVNYKKAVMNLEKSKSANSKFVLSSLVLGLCYSKMDNFKAAETNFNDVLKITPQNKVALTALAILLYNRKKYGLSVQYLNTLIDLDGSNVKIRELKSYLLLKTGAIDESAEEIKSITKISDGYKYYDDFIKSVPVEAFDDKYGTIDEKIEILKDTVDKDKKNLISLSLCHLFKGETDNAIDYLFQYKKHSTGKTGLTEKAV